MRHPGVSYRSQQSRRVRAGWACVLLLLALPRAHAAINVDNIASAVSSAPVSSISWSHTVGFNPNLVLIVGLSFRDGNVSASSVTYGGTALTKITSVNAGGNQNRTELWYLLAPPVGTATVAVTMSASKNVAATSVSYSGVNQSSPLGTSSTGTSGGSTTASVLVASAAGQLVIDTVTANGDANSLTAGGSQTQLWNLHSGNGDASNARGAGSTQPGALSTTMTWALGVSKPWSIAAVPLQAAPASTSFAGTVYNDANANGALDGSETGTGVSRMYVKLAQVSSGACSKPALAAAAVNTASGTYGLNGISAGSYCLILSNNSSLPNINPVVPAGWIGTQNASGIIRVTAAVPGFSPPQNFGLYNGSSVSGTVFADNGQGSGTANNGTQDGSEAGINAVLVQTSGATTTSVSTASSGAYTLWVPATASGLLTITPSLPTGDLATGGSAGTTGGAYARPSVAFTPTAGTTYTGVNFGLVPPNSLTPSGAQQSQPGATVSYAHTFIAGSAGQVTFSLAGSATPATPAWTQVLYQDTSCSGTPSSADTVITAALTVTAGQKVCVLVTVQVPAGALAGAQSAITLSAAFTYTNASPALAATTTASDVTTVASPGSLGLTKLVSDVTLGTGAATSVNANPGDTLQYTLSATNSGSQSLATLVIYDSTPFFTTFVSTTCPGSLPTGITGCTVTTQPAAGSSGSLQWTFTGSLRPAAVIVVTYQVKVGS